MKFSMASALLGLATTAAAALPSKPIYAYILNKPNGCIEFGVRDNGVWTVKDGTSVCGDNKPEPYVGGGNGYWVNIYSDPGGYKFMYWTPSHPDAADWWVLPCTEPFEGGCRGQLNYNP
jgi:hypothetical protein